jgi:hypothetical protein
MLDSNLFIDLISLFKRKRNSKVQEANKIDQIEKISLETSQPYDYFEKKYQKSTLVRKFYKP